MGAIFSCLEANKKRNERKMAEFAQSKRGQRVMNSKRMVRYREKRLKAMQPEVERRIREEGDHTKGEQVWFSRYISNGRLRHWVLLAHGNKYELRRSENISDESRDERRGESEFTYHVAPFTIDEEKRRATLAETSLPDIDGFYVCLIGWTTKTKAQVDQTCQSILQQFGTYHLLWKNCQHFLRMLADKIVDATAADYPWFRDNTKLRYQRTQALMPPPLELLMRLQLQMAGMMQMQTQNQIRMQMQTQVQIQNQIQMQIQTQIQNQMSMQSAGAMMG